MLQYVYMFLCSCTTHSSKGAVRTVSVSIERLAFARMATNTITIQLPVYPIAMMIARMASVPHPEYVAVSMATAVPATDAMPFAKSLVIRLPSF